MIHRQMDWLNLFKNFFNEPLFAYTLFLQEKEWTSNNWRHFDWFERRAWWVASAEKRKTESNSGEQWHFWNKIKSSQPINLIFAVEFFCFFALFELKFPFFRFFLQHWKNGVRMARSMAFDISPKRNVIGLKGIDSESIGHWFDAILSFNWILSQFSSIRKKRRRKGIDLSFFLTFSNKNIVICDSGSGGW